MRFKYRVRDTGGAVVRGVLEAEHKEAMIAGLLQQGYTITGLWNLDAGRTGRELHRPVRLEARELASFTRQLAVMLAAGLSLMDSLETLQQQTRAPLLRSILAKVADELRAGTGLGEALGHYPKVFPPVYINTVKAGEASGSLDTIFLQLDRHLQRGQELNRKLRSASAYPIFTTLLALVILVIMMAFVTPRFAGIFEASGAQLPRITRVLLEGGRLLPQALLVFLLTIGTVLLSVKFIHRSERGLTSVDALRLRLPVIGNLERKKIMASFTGTMEILLQAGILVLPALQVTAAALANRKGGEMLREVAGSVGSGEGLAGPLARSGLFPPMLTDMVAVGEATGSLDTVLGQLSEYYDLELSASLESLGRLVEPLLILVVAVIVGAVMMALLLPMLSMVSLIGM